MELSPFRIERFYAQYEHSTRFMLSSSDCQSRTIAELLELAPVDVPADAGAARVGFIQPVHGPSIIAFAN